MTSLLSLASVIALGLAVAQSAPQNGRYQPQYPNVYSSGSSDSNDGRYIPDDSGSYSHDGTGSYVPDNSGAYVPDDNEYYHQVGASGSNFGGSGGAGGIGGFGGSGGGSGGSGLFGGSLSSGGLRGGSLGGSTTILGTGLGRGSGLGLGSVSSTPSSLGVYGTNRNVGNYAPSQQGTATGLYDNKNYAIIRKIENVEPEGYNYLYETENKIYAEEEGHLANKGTENEAIQAKGYFTYTGPDNVVYTVEYTADENGFVPRGAHLPTPPPTPEAILRSLAYQQSIGEL